jgi:hypothetical protein
MPVFRQCKALDVHSRSFDWLELGDFRPANALLLSISQPLQSESAADYLACAKTPMNSQSFLVLHIDGLHQRYQVDDSSSDDLTKARTSPASQVVRRGPSQSGSCRVYWLVTANLGLNAPELRQVQFRFGRNCPSHVGHVIRDRSDLEEGVRHLVCKLKVWLVVLMNYHTARTSFIDFKIEICVKE